MRHQCALHRAQFARLAIAAVLFCLAASSAGADGSSFNLSDCGYYDSPGFAAGLYDEFRFTLDSEEMVFLEPVDRSGGCLAQTILLLLGPDGLAGADIATENDPCTRLSLLLPAGEYTARVDELSYGALRPYSLRYSHQACAICGNGFLDVSEECDGSDANRCASGPCTAACICSLAPRCGDSTVQPELGEACDDGNVAPGDGCDSSCQREIVRLDSCGTYRSSGFWKNSFNEYSFVLDTDSTIRLEVSDGDSGCSDDVQIVIYDSAGVVRAYDNDDGHQLCPLVVQPLPAGEYRVRVSKPLFADPEWTIRPYALRYFHSGCSACGNGILEAEGCDDGNLSVGDGCDSNCGKELTELDHCGTYYSPGFGAGDFDEYILRLDSEETVLIKPTDANGDCVGDAVQLESEHLSVFGFCPFTFPLPADTYIVRVTSFRDPVGPYALEYATRSCSSTCGNGIVELGEGCDDGNLLDGDGCNAGCEREPVVMPVCGEYASPGFTDNGYDVFGLTLASEETVRLETWSTDLGCPDDMDIVLNSEDGHVYEFDDDGGLGLCSKVLRSAPPGRYRVFVTGSLGAVGPYTLQFFTTSCSSCGNGVLEAEECDDGNSLDGDGCSGSCQHELPVLEDCVAFQSAGFLAGDSAEYILDLQTDSIVALEVSTGESPCGVTMEVQSLNAPFEIRWYESCLETEELPAGTYSVRLESYKTAIGPYTVVYRTPACSRCGNEALELGEECDDGNELDGDGCDSDCVRRTPIRECGRYTPSVLSARGASAFRLELEQPELVRFETTGLDGICGVDTTLGIYDATGKLLFYDDQGGEQGCSKLVANLAPGSYRIVVEAVEGNAFGSYVLLYSSRSCSDCGDHAVGLGEQCDDGSNENGDGCDSACQREPKILSGCGQTPAAALEQGETADFVFTASVAGQFEFETTSIYGSCLDDTVLEIYDGESTTQLAADNDGGDDGCSRLSLPLDAGTFRLSVREFSGGVVRPYVVRHWGPSLCGNCGNGAVDEGEPCDDGDPFFIAGEPCGADCQSTPCGHPVSAPSLQVTILDALFILRASAGLSWCDLAVCDVDSSGVVVATDALTTLKAAVGLENRMHCP